MTEIMLRDCAESDVTRIAEIYGFHVRTAAASFEIEAPDAEEIGRRRAGVLSAGLPYLVAEVEGKVAGYAYAGPYRPRPAYRFTVENSVYVDPAYPRLGIGRRLLAELIARCEEGPWRQMIAVIGDSGNEASIGLHRTLGFAHVGVLRGVGWKFDRWVDTVLMQRALRGGTPG